MFERRVVGRGQRRGRGTVVGDNGSVRHPRKKSSRLPKFGPVIWEGYVPAKRMKYTDDKGEREVLILWLEPDILNPTPNIQGEK